MSDIEIVAQSLAGQLKRRRADYLEARLEESQTSHITYRGRELESVGRSTASGGNVRALVKGGWGFTSFNSLEDLPGRIAQAVEQARAAGRGKSALAPAQPVARPCAQRCGARPGGNATGR